MKNLLYVKDYDKLLQGKVNRARFYEQKKVWTSFHRRTETHRVGDYYPWEYADRILRKSVGKPFCHAFHTFCQKVPDYMQKVFLEYFQDDAPLRSDFLIDENGLIQTNGHGMLFGRRYRRYNGKPRVYVAYTSDYKTEWRHKISGKLMPERYTKDRWYFNHGWYNDYEEVIISGKKFESSTKTPLYRRLTQERMQRERLRYRRDKKVRRETQYCFKTKQELGVIDGRKNDITKIESHGFDPITSFRNM